MKTLHIYTYSRHKWSVVSPSLTILVFVLALRLLTSYNYCLVCITFAYLVFILSINWDFTEIVMYGQGYMNIAADRDNLNLTRNLRDQDVIGLPIPQLSDQPLLARDNIAHSTVNHCSVPELNEFDPMANLSPSTAYNTIDETGFSRGGAATMLSPSLVHRLVPGKYTEPKVTRFDLGDTKIKSQDRALAPARELSSCDRICMTELIRRLPTCSGDNEGHLLNFLQKVIPIFAISPGFEVDTMKLILPCTSEGLFNIWVGAIQTRMSWSELHCAILDSYFPGVHRKRLETQYIFRKQSPTETFPQFVEDIVGSAKALQLHWPEFHIVEIILANIAPYVRSHLVMQNKPFTISGLRTLAGHVNATAMADTRYFQTFAHSTQAPPYMPSEAVVNQSQSNVSLNNNRKCYKCNGFGHIAKNCLNFRRGY